MFLVPEAKGKGGHKIDPAPVGRLGRKEEANVTIHIGLTGATDTTTGTETADIATKTAIDTERNEIRTRPILVDLTSTITK